MVTFIAKKKAVHKYYIDKQKTQNRKDDNQKTSPRINKSREDTKPNKITNFLIRRQFPRLENIEKKGQLQ